VIPLVLAMLRARRGQALTVALLAMFAAAAAVAAPAYLRATDAAVVAGEVASASPAERSVTISSTVDAGMDTGGPDFAHTGAALVSLPGFTEVYASEYPTLGLSPDPHAGARLTYRQDACAHLAIVRGRCLIGAAEILVGEATARRLHLAPGDLVTLTFARASQDPTQPFYLPAGTPTPLTVVGTYEPVDPGGTYWGTHGYFGALAGAGQPVFTNAATIAAMDHEQEQVSIDAIAAPGTVTADRLARVRSELRALDDRVADLGGAVTVTSAMPDLLTRVDRSRTLAHQVVPVAAVPLVLLSWFVIFLAAGYGIHGRRQELGLVALRGLRRPARWGLAAAESLVPIAAGSVAGFLAGPLVVGALAAWRLAGAAGPSIGAGQAGYALAAGSGAALAALLAQRRALRTPTADLLRRVPGARAGWRAMTAEAAIVVLAIVAAVQLRVSGGTLLGLGVLVPALVILALALVWARALAPLAGLYGVRALRRGRTATALAALHLARRPGAQRLLVVLVAAVAMLGFAAAAVDVATQSRAVRAQVGTGASRVLSVAPVTRDQLLHAVRAADPDGRFAMAVATVPGGAPGEAPRLAVDATRLATVASWPAAAAPLPAAQVAARLHPPAPAPVVLRGQDIALDVTVSGAAGEDPLELAVTLSSTTGRGTAIADFGVVRDGPVTYQRRVPECLDGCRLVAIHVTGQGQYTVTLLLRSLRVTSPDATVVSAARFAAPGTWRVASTATLSSSPAGLRADFHPPYATQGDGWLQPADAPLPLPVVSTAALPAGTRLAGLDKLPTPVVSAGRVAALPRLGTDGVLVDLEYADRVSTDAGQATAPQVWLGPAAPPDVLTRLAAHGLVVTGDQRVGAVRHALGQQGPALALWFQLLSGGFAIVLAAGAVHLVAAVDRGPRAEELAALRIQGVRRQGALGAGVVVVLAGTVAGMVTAACAWWVAGAGLPLFLDGRGPWPLPAWPRPLSVLLPGLGAAALLLLVSLAAWYGLRRAVARRTSG
jgi:putative ABC transport system permease protein